MLCPDFIEAERKIKETKATIMPIVKYFLTLTKALYNRFISFMFLSSLYII